jgi:hypothetical protein
LNPASPDEWLELAKQHEAAARVLASSGETASRSLHHVGSAVECTLKAVVMKAERLNTWPERPEYFTHDLKALRVKAGLALANTDAVAPKWAVVVQWDRHQDYSPKKTPIIVAQSYVEAAFGIGGVVEWIKSQN